MCLPYKPRKAVTLAASLCNGHAHCGAGPQRPGMLPSIVRDWALIGIHEGLPAHALPALCPTSRCLTRLRMGQHQSDPPLLHACLLQTLPPSSRRSPRAPLSETWRQSGWMWVRWWPGLGAIWRQGVEGVCHRCILSLTRALMASDGPLTHRLIINWRCQLYRLPYGRGIAAATLHWGCGAINI